MTEKQIQEQIDAIRKATAEACKSKEAAIKFLTDARIINMKRKTIKRKRQIPSEIGGIHSLVAQLVDVRGF